MLIFGQNQAFRMGNRVCLISLLKTSELKLFKMMEKFFALGGINLAVSHCWWQV